MFLRSSLLVSFIISFCCNIDGQSSVKGKVYEAVTDSLLAGVNIHNLTSKQTARTTAAGIYAINAAEGDTLIFSLTGYEKDTIYVTYSALLLENDITLQKQIITLAPVSVTSSYHADSLARRNFYSSIYNQAGITGRNTPAHGFGISISPFSFFSKKSQRERQLKKRLIRQEHEAYIDRSFPTEFVAKLTGLRGDSLHRFVAIYRPTYEFCRKSSREQMILYINEKFKEFKKPKA